MLTPRQYEVLIALAQGQSVKAISSRLGLSVKTVETHRANMMKRLDARNGTELVLFAVYHNLVALSPRTSSSTGSVN